MAEDPPPRSGRGTQRGAALLLLAIIGASISLTVSRLQWFRGSKPSPSAEIPAPNPTSPGAGQERIAGYIGASSCRECHPGESALFARSGHRRTLWRATLDQNPVVAWLKGRMTKDPDIPEVRWAYDVREGRLVAERTIDGRSESFPLDYGLGSGTHGVTFVTLGPGAESGLSPSGIEHRLSYFADGRRLGLTPGQERSASEKLESHEIPSGKAMGPERIQQCFNCHATLTSTLDSNRLEPATLIPGVSCERCHGPGRAHVEAARRGEEGLTMRMGHERGEPWVEVNQCGSCHRVPRDVSSGQLRPDNPQIARFQGVGISLSACYARGLGGLRCISCHDPHDRISTDRVAYEAVCLSCHSADSKPKPRICPTSPASKCIDCHMPRREISGNGWFTDHWIRKPDY